MSELVINATEHCRCVVCNTEGPIGNCNCWKGAANEEDDHDTYLRNLRRVLTKNGSADALDTPVLNFGDGRKDIHSGDSLPGDGHETIGDTDDGTEEQYDEAPEVIGPQDILAMMKTSDTERKAMEAEHQRRLAGYGNGLNDPGTMNSVIATNARERIERKRKQPRKRSFVSNIRPDSDVLLMPGD